MNQTNSHLLVAAAFVLLGFILGRITAPNHHPHGKHEGRHFKGAGFPTVSSDEEVQVIVKTLENSGFEGDTVFAIPGGSVRLSKSGEDVQVVVEMETSDEDDSSEVNWIQKNDERTVITKHIVVTAED